MESKTPEAVKRANKKWKESNKEKQKLYRYRSNARIFIRDMATEEDLDAILSYVEERRRLLEEQPEKSPKKS